MTLEPGGMKKRLAIRLFGFVLGRLAGFAPVFALGRLAGSVLVFAQWNMIVCQESSKRLVFDQSCRNAPIDLPRLRPMMFLRTHVRLRLAAPKMSA